MRVPGFMALGGAVRAAARPRVVSTVLIVLGLITAVAMLLVPVEATLSRDPLLRLGTLGSDQQPQSGQVDCGSALSNLGHFGGVSFYEIARTDVCRQATRRRAAAAVASGGMIVLVGLIGLTVTARREPDAYAPAPAPSAEAQALSHRLELRVGPRQGEDESSLAPE